MGNRYSIIRDKNPREIVLLKSFPCKYGKCTFCNYIEDNSLDEEEINKINFIELEKITGELKILEVINSGSVFEIPKKTLEKIREISKEKNIRIIYFEAYWSYKNRLKEIIEFFKGFEIRFKVGIESFDENFRNNILNKGLYYSYIEEISNYFYSVCLMVCMEGQSKEMIEKDIELALRYFKRVTVNVFINNGTKIKQDKKLLTWFLEEYKYLEELEDVELLYDNKDFGVYEQ